MATRTIKLGADSYEITVPLTLGQCIDCNIELGEDDATPEGETTKQRSKRIYRRTVSVLCAALSVEHPDLGDPDKLLATRGISITQINAAVKVIYEETGLISRGDAAPGEASEGAV